MTDTESKYCSSAGGGVHDGWYGRLGFSPCGKYVAHESNTPCDVINSTEVIEVSSDPHNCQCNTALCYCGDFVSHMISEPCTAR